MFLLIDCSAFMKVTHLMHLIFVRSVYATLEKVFMEHVYHTHSLNTWG